MIDSKARVLRSKEDRSLLIEVSSTTNVNNGSSDDET